MAGLTAGLGVGVVAGLAVGLVVGLDRRDPFPPGELVILSGRDDSVGGVRQQLIDQWNRLHPRNHASIRELPPVADAQRAQMVASAQSGEDGADIYNLDVTWTAEFAERGYIRPLQETDTSGFLDQPLQTCRYDGVLWALPFNTDAGLLYYRTDMVSEPPDSWPQLQRAVDEVLARPRRPGETLVAGYAAQLANYEGLTVNVIEAVQAAAGGSDLVDGNDIAVEQEDLQLAVDRLRPGSNGSQLILPRSLDFAETQTTQAFAKGEVLFMRNWPVAYRTLSQPPQENGAGPVRFDVAPLPGPSVLGGQNLAIASSSDNPGAAQALIEYLTSARSQQLLFERGGLAATHEVVYQDAEVRDRYPYADVLLQAIRQARPRPVTPCYPQFSELFRSVVDQALREGEPLPEDFRDRLESVLSNC